jgi:hypothetical protein
MTDLLPAPVPELDEGWLAARREHLVRELAAPAPSPRVSRRGVLGGVGAVCGAGAASAAGLILAGGPGASSAFAGWRAAPSVPAAGQLQSATARCEQPQPKAPPPGGVSTSLGPKPSGGPPAWPDPSTWRLQVSDVRGPFSMLVFSAPPDATVMCIAGPDFSAISLGVNHSAAAGGVLANGIAIERYATARNPQGPEPYTFVVGRVGSAVSAATLQLSDGTTVTATVSGGRLLAWWPGQAAATAAQLTTPSATVTQALSAATPPEQPTAHVGTATGSCRGVQGADRPSTCTAKAGPFVAAHSGAATGSCGGVQGAGPSTCAGGAEGHVVRGAPRGVVVGGR